MLVIKSIRYRNKFLIPAIIPSLVAADQQNRTAERLKSIEHPVRLSRMLYRSSFGFGWREEWMRSA
jgi:hypothetical protein